MIVARDLAHAKIRDAAGSRRSDAALFQASPDLLCRPGQDAGGSTPPAPLARPRRAAWIPMSINSRPRVDRMIMLAKGNRAPEVREACARHGGFYLGSIGGAAARLAQDCIKKVEVLELSGTMAWKRSGGSRSRISPPSSSSTTRAMISSRS